MRALLIVGFDEVQLRWHNRIFMVQNNNTRSLLSYKIMKIIILNSTLVKTYKCYLKYP